MLQPPCGDSCGLSCSCAALRGLEHGDPGWALVPPGPFDVQRPSGTRPTRRPAAEAAGGPPWTSALLQSSSPGSRTVPPVARLGGRHFLSWTLLALRHSLRPVDTLVGGGSLHHRGATCGVWLPPSRLLPPALPTLSRRSVHGLHPSRSSLRRNRSPSRGPYPPAVTRLLSRRPEGLHSCKRGRLQGLVPATNPCSRRNHEWFQPSIPSWGSPLQSLLPSDLALALVAAPPLSPSGGLTSQSVWASGSCGTQGWVSPSPDHQLSWVSLPFDDHDAPFTSPQGGLIASPHPRPHQGGVGRSMPLGRGATTNPGLAARHRRHSACDR